MVCTIVAMRCGQQRTFARIFQDFKVATARSPTVRMRAWTRLTFFCARDRRGRCRCRLYGRRPLGGVDPPRYVQSSKCLIEKSSPGRIRTCAWFLRVVTVGLVSFRECPPGPTT